MTHTRSFAAGVCAALLATAPALTAQTASADTGQAAGAPVRHTVKKGDTLWDIARAYLNDPFKWPQVFHANTDIVKNPHWIYPGQVLTIDRGAVKAEIAARTDKSGFVVSEVKTRAQEPTVFLDGTHSAIGPNIATIAPPPALTVRQGEYEAAPYVVDSRAPLGAGRVLGAVETLALGLKADAGFRFNDRLYVTAPAGSTPAVGSELLLARADRRIADVGLVVEPTGIVRVDSIGSKGIVIATLVKQFAAVVPEQAVLAVGQSFEATTRRPVSGMYPLASKVLWIQNAPALPSVQSYVILGATAAKGVRAGDRFTLYDDAPSAAASGTPPIATATVTVVRVTPFGASAIVVDQSQPHIHQGMPARLTAKMP